MWLVKCIAGARSLGLPPSVERSDVEQAGYLGLIAAARRYEAGSTASFVTFARFRVNGAITDYLRGLDGASKEHRRQIKVEEAEEVVEVSLDALRGAHSTSETPEEASMALEFSQQLRSLVEGLDGRDRTIIQQYYFRGSNMEQIAHELGVGTPRVSQLHTRILRRMAEAPGFVVRRQAFRFALTSGLLRRLGSAALGLVAAFLLTVSGLNAQTRVTTPSLSGTPGANPRVWVVMPNGTLSEAELENIQLVVENGKPILRAAPAQKSVVKSKFVLANAIADFPLVGALDAVYRNGLLQAEGDDYTIVNVGGVSTLRFNANAIPQAKDIVQIRELR